MTQPIMDMNSHEYLELLKQRHLQKEYKQYYSHMKWALETLDELEKKTIFSNHDYMYFTKAKTIINFVITETKKETLDKHTTPKYKWKTRGDGKVRSRHAKFDGKIFSWDNPPEGGYHPGEDYGCRCIAEPHTPESKKLQESVSQVVTSAVADEGSAWGSIKLGFHYRFAKGKDLKLHEIGLLGKIINHAKNYNQSGLSGGGSIFERIENQIFAKARENGEGSFSDNFRRGDYNFGDVAWALGHVPVHGKMNVNVIEKGEYLIITADIDYSFIDYFIVDALNVESGQDIGTTPFYITGEWSTRLEATIRKKK